MYVNIHNCNGWRKQRYRRFFPPQNKNEKKITISQISDLFSFFFKIVRYRLKNGRYKVKIVRKVRSVK